MESSKLKGLSQLSRVASTITPRTPEISLPASPVGMDRRRQADKRQADFSQETARMTKSTESSTLARMMRVSKPTPRETHETHETPEIQEHHGDPIEVFSAAGQTTAHPIAKSLVELRSNIDRSRGVLSHRMDIMDPVNSHELPAKDDEAMERPRSNDKWMAENTVAHMKTIKADNYDEEDVEHMEYYRTHWPIWRFLCWYLTTSKTFKAISVGNILANAVFMCIEVNHPQGTYPWLAAASTTCTVLFGIEVAIRVAGSTFDHFWMDGWLLSDVVIFSTAILQLIMEPFVEYAMEKDGGGKRLQLLRTFQLLRLLRLFRLGKVFADWRPLRVILRAISKAWENVIAACVFIGMQWLTFAILTSAMLGHPADKEPDDALRVTLKQYFGSVPRSFITALEATVGGVEWGEEILYPLFATGAPGYMFAGVCLLLSILFSTFCLWNLVLGIYVRQVIMIAKDYDDEKDHEDLLNAEGRVHDLRTLLDSVDEDRDGFISTREVQEGIMNNPQAVEKLGIGAKEIEVLHAALDTEGKGMVGVSELLFGVLKLAGTSKTIDMLSIDYRQKVFLRDITNLQKSSVQDLDKLNKSLDKVVRATLQLKTEMHGLRAGIDKAKEDLMAEIAREDALVEEACRDAQEVAALEEARFNERNSEARNAIQEHVENLRSQVIELDQARRLENLCAGSRTDAAKLRAAVRRRLQTQLGPWLQWELLEAGGIR